MYAADPLGASNAASSRSVQRHVWPMAVGRRPALERKTKRRDDALAILLVGMTWLSLSFFVAPAYGDRSVWEQLFFGIYGVAVGVTVGFYLFDRLPRDGFGLFALRAASVMLVAVLLNEAIIEPLVFGLEPISRAGIYYALTDGLSITAVFVLIRLAQRLPVLRQLEPPQSPAVPPAAPLERKPTQADDDCMFVRVAGGTRRIYVADIIYMRAERDFTRIVCVQGEHFVSESLKSLLIKSAVFGLVRIHKSFAVNPSRVDQVARSRIEAGGCRLPVGRRYWPEVARSWGARPAFRPAG